MNAFSWGVLLQTTRHFLTPSELARTPEEAGCKRVRHHTTTRARVTHRVVKRKFSPPSNIGQEKRKHERKHNSHDTVLIIARAVRFSW